MKILWLALGIFAANILVAENLQSTQWPVENGLRPKAISNGVRPLNIRERMAYYQVPAVSLAVVNEGQIEWAKGYGHITRDPNSPPVDTHTLFQAGSISKPVTAFGALLLVQQGRIALDEDVNRYLIRWKIPENAFTQTEKVSLRRLLSHTAGINIHGFGGYDRQDPLPTLIDILIGRKPLVRTPPVKVVSTPGTVFKYSGGGYLIVQLLIEDITGEPFDVWMQNNVLNPLGMTESTFKQPLPPPYAAQAAHGYNRNDAPVPGGWHHYPQMAPGGLWTTPRDLAKLMVYIQSALRNENAQLLHTRFVRAMLTRQPVGNTTCNYGLGFALQNDGENLVFSHNGKVDGFIANFYGYAYRGQGLVIMLNSVNGKILRNEITNSVADAYNWPNFQPVEIENLYE